MGEYQRYEKRYNGKTKPLATNAKRWWTAADEARLMKTWCHAASSAASRIHAARVLGRSYVACAKRHTSVHQRHGSWSSCKADRRRRES